ncbi:MAG: hypothetical protein A2X49_03185 [Lentisphaerae bacterium GWF2_52_8]|nr:MAG: hypothetical protein A2X49_03185 [Lentisphaerae bacterium GWF2_52_8]
MPEVETHYFESWDSLNAVFAGNAPGNLKESERRLSVQFVARDSWIKIVADSRGDRDKAVAFLSELTRIYSSTGRPVTQSDFEQVLSAFEERREADLQLFYAERVRVSPRKKDLVPRNRAQLEYLRDMRRKDITFGIGPAGTGKTYLAMGMAVSQLLEGHCSRIILSRPAVEAGESLGFLPGNLEEKILPYLRPLYDALYDMLDFEEASSLLEKKIIEMAPLAFMRGRTLNNAFIILDEAQNTTVEQMLMFLTRMGFNSKCVIAGDPSQMDLSNKQASGLLHSTRVLKDIDEIAIRHFSSKDVVRHPLVEKIVNAYQQKHHETGPKA